VNAHEIIITADGSHTLFVPSLDETYHSAHGAVQESRHVFIENGLKFLLPRYPAGRAMNILEVGFGTGLNAWLTYMDYEQQNITVRYDAIEPHPLVRELVAELNYIENGNAEHAAVFYYLHDSRWDEPVQVSEPFTLTKYCTTLQEIMFTRSYDLVYFDAFGPGKQPELWTEAIFMKLFGAMNAGGVLVTYSSKGTVKQALRAAGFEVRRLKGPPGKRHMLRAMKV
jgi:tRNA U34 5-methylaminomethyl-2-thiouridine-forming methyltransferase MnmC